MRTPTTEDPFRYARTAPHPANSPRGVVLELDMLLTGIAGFTKLIQMEPGKPGDQEVLDELRSRMRQEATVAVGLGLVSAEDVDLLADGPIDEAVVVLNRLWSMGCTCDWCAEPA